MVYWQQYAAEWFEVQTARLQLILPWLVCVIFVFWKELNKCFLKFFLESLFFAMLGILSNPLLLWLKSTARCRLSNTCPLFAITSPLNRNLHSVYRQSTCWYGNVLVIQSEPVEMVGLFHKWKYSHKWRSYLIGLTINTSLLFPRNIISHFSLEKSSFSSSSPSSSFHFSNQQNWIGNGLQHYSDLWQTVLQRLCWLWQVSREIWTKLLDQNWLHLLGYYTKSAQNRRQKCRFSTEIKPSNGKSWFQPVYSTKKPTSSCSRQLS